MTAAAGTIAEVISAAVAFAAFCYAAVVGRAQKNRAAAAELDDVSRRVAVLETQVAVFWKNVAFDAAAILHSPHPGRERLDLLLERYGSEMLTSAELAELAEKLAWIRDGEPGTGHGERMAAALLLRAIETQQLIP